MGDNQHGAADGLICKSSDQPTSGVATAQAIPDPAYREALNLCFTLMQPTGHPIGKGRKLREWTGGVVCVMKTTGNETEVVHMSLDLLAEARRVANEEHRPTEELVSDAVRRYLQERAQIAPYKTAGPEKRKRLSELFAPLRGLDIDFSRNPSIGRPVDL